MDNYLARRKFLLKEFYRFVRIRWKCEVKEITLTWIGKKWGTAEIRIMYKVVQI